MTPKYVFILLFVLQLRLISAQNLLLNPGFEAYTVCPGDVFSLCDVWQYNNIVDTSTGFVGGTYHYLNSCATGDWDTPSNYLGYQVPHSGNGYVSVSLGTIYQELSNTLVADAYYRFEMYVSIANVNFCRLDWSTNFAMFATPTSLPDLEFSSLTTQWIHTENYSTIVPTFANLENVSDTIHWHKIGGCFRAKGDEKFITITLNKFDFEASCEVGAFIFFLIDDVLIEAVAPDEPISIDTTKCMDKPLILNAAKLLNLADTTNAHCAWDDDVQTFERALLLSGDYQAKITDECGEKVLNLSVSDIACGCQIFVPNIITPNNDNQNDTFIPYISCTNATIENYSFKIFDRWGTLIFASNDPLQPWDGTYRGKPVEGVFVWILNFDTVKPSGREPVNHSGDVSVLR